MKKGRYKKQFTYCMISIYMKFTGKTLSTESKLIVPGSGEREVTAINTRELLEIISQILIMEVYYTITYISQNSLNFTVANFSIYKLYFNKTDQTKKENPNAIHISSLT